MFRSRWFIVWSVPAYLYSMVWCGDLGLNDSKGPWSLFGDKVGRWKALGCLTAVFVTSLTGTATDERKT
jgi:hypothetical protein